MSRGGNYTLGKRQRDAAKSKKKQEKADRRMRRRERGPGDVPLASAEEITGALPSVDEAMEAMAERARAPRGAASVPCRLFVGGLGWGVTEDQLREAFGSIGPVSDAFIVKDRDTGRSRGFGFVTMESRKDAAKAIETLHQTELEGRTIVVNVATER